MRTPSGAGRSTALAPSTTTDSDTSRSVMNCTRSVSESEPLTSARRLTAIVTSAGDPGAVRTTDSLRNRDVGCTTFGRADRTQHGENDPRGAETSNRLQGHGPARHDLLYNDEGKRPEDHDDRDVLPRHADQ